MPGSIKHDEVRKQVFVENYDGVENKDAPVEVTSDLKEGVYIGKCKGGVFQITTKTKSICISNCSDIGVICSDVVSRIEIINCKKVNVQSTGMIPIVQADKSDRCNIYVSAESVADIQFFSSACSGCNIFCPTADGEDMVESPIPEMVKSVYVDGKLVSTVQTE